MELRSGQVVMPEQGRLAFEEGVRLLFKKWTALALAVEHQWGGPTSSEKANWLLSESINWFYRNKEHYWDDLAEELDDALLQDFNVEAEDGSPDEIAKALVSLYKECMDGNYSSVLQLRSQAGGPSGAAQSHKQVVDQDGTVLNGDDGSSSEDDGEDAGMDTDAAPQALPLQQQEQPQRQEPLIDEDGFQLVQGKGRKGRR